MKDWVKIAIEWQEYERIKAKTGMVIDHLRLADSDSHLTEHYIEHVLNKKAWNLRKKGSIKLGKLGRKCNR